MKIFDGNEHAKLLEQKIKDFVSKNEPEGNLAILLIGDDPASEKYVTIKEKVAKRLGVPVKVVRIDHTKMKSLEVVVRGSDVIYSPSNTSVIIQVPLPERRFYSLLTKIPYEKDVDMLSEGAKRKFLSGDFSRTSPVIRAIEYFIDSNKLEIKGSNVLVVGFGDLVGKPTSFYLENKGANVKITENYKPEDSYGIDLIVLSSDVPNLVNPKDLPKGCNVIDFGSSVVDGKTVGNLDMSKDISHLGIVSLSPGGMGPLVIRFLLMNHLGI